MTTTRGAGLDPSDVTVGGSEADPANGSTEGIREDEAASHSNHPSPFARLGRGPPRTSGECSSHGSWSSLVFGFFAVHVESALAGAGWQASNSQSVAARAVIQKDFSGLGATGLQVVIVDHHGPIASDPHAQAVVAKATSVLRSDPRVSTVVPPQAGVSISRDGRTAIITAGSAADSNKMVQAADAVQPKLAALSTSGVTRDPDRRQCPVGRLQHGQPLGHAAVGDAVLAGHDHHPRDRLREPGGCRAAAAADDGRPTGRGRRPGHHHQVHPGVHLGPQLRPDVRPRPGDRLRPLPGHAIPFRPRAAESQAGGPRGHRRLGGRDGGHRRQSRGLQRADRAGIAGGHPDRSEPGVPFDGVRDHVVRGGGSGRNPHPLAGGPRQTRDQHQQGQDPAAPRPSARTARVRSTGCCTRGGSSSGATPFPSVPPPWSFCCLPRRRSSACGPTCPRSPSCRPAPTPESATTR